MSKYVIAGNDADKFSVWVDETGEIKGCGLTFEEAVELRKVLENGKEG